MDKRYSIAIDGPSGAGKSSLAKALAKDYGFIYVDTGAIYRVVGLAARIKRIDSRDAEGVCGILDSIEIGLEYVDGQQRMFLDGNDVTGEIRTPEISKYASDVSAIPGVRAYMLEMQRQFARDYSVIMDGRDIGTVVLPGADIKFFVYASAEVRAERRFRELQEKGNTSTYEEILESIKYRDNQDSSRSTAPLKAADDAVMFDNGAQGFDESLSMIENMIFDKLGISTVNK